MVCISPIRTFLKMIFLFTCSPKIMLLWWSTILSPKKQDVVVCFGDKRTLNIARSEMGLLLCMIIPFIDCFMFLNVFSTMLQNIKAKNNFILLWHVCYRHDGIYLGNLETNITYGPAISLLSITIRNEISIWKKYFHSIYNR